MWNDTCKCIDENWKALKARIQASITGITVNGITHYQTDGTGICDLGEIEGTTDANEIFLKDGRSVETAIVTIDTALPGKVIDVEPSAVTGGINLNETDGNGTTARMLIRADDTLKFDGLTVGISDATNARITQAQADATTAGTKADDAQADADSAMTAATTANGTANTALTKADTANATAHNAYELATSANDRAMNAYTGFGISVVDTALEATLDKNDGTSETKQLFSIGDGLEWADTVLKATGGSDGGGVTVTTLAEYTPTVGDIITLIKSVNIKNMNIPSSYIITTGAYGGEMHSRLNAYTNTRLTYGQTIQFLACQFVVSVIANGVCALSPIGAGGNILHSADTITVSSNITIDGADAIKGDVSIFIPYSQRLTAYYVQTSLPGEVSVTISQDAIAIYEGVSTTIPVTFNVSFSSSSTCYVIKAQTS